MTSTDIAPVDIPALEKALVNGDLASLSSAERVSYYRQVCESLGLNPLTRPFQYLQLSGRLTLYATKDATEQLRRRDEISIRLVAREMHADVGAYVVTAQASTPSGRTDEATGAVSISGLRGESLANALMKAETKAKRRVTLSICGLGFLDESEVDSPSPAVDLETGEFTTNASFAEAGSRLVSALTDQGHSADDAKRIAAEVWERHGLRRGQAVPRSLLDEILAAAASIAPEQAATDAQEAPGADEADPSTPIGAKAGQALHRYMGAKGVASKDDQQALIVCCSNGRTTHASQLTRPEKIRVEQMADDIAEGRLDIQRVRAAVAEAEGVTA